MYDHLLLGFAENQSVFWDFKIETNIRITEGSDNGDSDNTGSTVFTSDSVSDLLSTGT